MRTYLDAIIEAVAAALMAGMCLVVFLGVFYRYALLDPLTWTEEIARLCLIWTTFLGTYLAYRRNIHISIDLIRRYVSLRTMRILHFASLILVGSFMTMLGFQGVEYSRAFLNSFTLVLGLSLGIIYFALPICAALMVLTIVIDLINFVRSGFMLPGEESKGDVI